MAQGTKHRMKLCMRGPFMSKHAPATWPAAAGVIDVARDVTAERGVAGPAIVDGEDPDALARQIPLFTPPRLRLRHQRAFVLDDLRVFADGLCGVNTPSR